MPILWLHCQPHPLFCFLVERSKHAGWNQPVWHSHPSPRCAAHTLYSGNPPGILNRVWLVQGLSFKPWRVFICHPGSEVKSYGFFAGFFCRSHKANKNHFCSSVEISNGLRIIPDHLKKLNTQKQCFCGVMGFLASFANLAGKVLPFQSVSGWRPWKRAAKLHAMASWISCRVPVAVADLGHAAMRKELSRPWL